MNIKGKDGSAKPGCNGAGGLSRRGFIRNTAAGALAGAAGVTGIGCAGLAYKSGPGGKKVRYVTLGRTGLRVSQFLGDRMADRKMYELALASGVNYWHKFGQWDEPAPYDIFRGMDRDSFYTDTVVHATEYDKAMEIFTMSLKKSGLGMIDGFKVHSVYSHPEEVRAKTGVLRAFEELKRQGKTRFLMLSQHLNVPDVLDAAIESDYFDLIQVPVNPMVPRKNVFDYSDNADHPQTLAQDRYFSLIKKAADRNIAVTAMKVFLYGPKNWEHVPNLREKVGGYLPDNKSIATALIHWALDVPGIVAYGSMLNSFEELEENLAAAGGRMSTAEREGIRRLAAAMDSSYCRMCGACERANPEGVAVSSILRFKGYSQGFGWREHSRALYAALPERSRVDAAVDLSGYERVCPYGLPLANLLTDAHRMLG